MTEEKEEDIPPHGLSKRLFSLYNKAKESGVTERALERFFVPFGPYADVVQAQRRKKGTERMKEKDKVTAKIKPVQEVVKYDIHGGRFLLRIRIYIPQQRRSGSFETCGILMHKIK